MPIHTSSRVYPSIISLPEIRNLQKLVPCIDAALLENVLDRTRLNVLVSPAKDLNGSYLTQVAGFLENFYIPCHREPVAYTPCATSAIYLRLVVGYGTKTPKTVPIQYTTISVVDMLGLLAVVQAQAICLSVIRLHDANHTLPLQPHLHGYLLDTNRKYSKAWKDLLKTREHKLALNLGQAASSSFLIDVASPWAYGGGRNATHPGAFDGMDTKMASPSPPTTKRGGSITVSMRTVSRAGDADNSPEAEIIREQADAEPNGGGSVAGSVASNASAETIRYRAYRKKVAAGKKKATTVTERKPILPLEIFEPFIEAIGPAPQGTQANPIVVEHSAPPTPRATPATPRATPPTTRAPQAEATRTTTRTVAPKPKYVDAATQTIDDAHHTILAMRPRPMLVLRIPERPEDVRPFEAEPLLAEREWAMLPPRRERGLVRGRVSLNDFKPESESDGPDAKKARRSI